jgi:hypothetical protein
MKLYSELSALESELIKLDTLIKTFSVIIDGTPHATRESIESAMYHIYENLQASVGNLQSIFNQAWDADRGNLNVEPDEE